MIHFRKLLFYLFLLVALSAASVVSVLKLSGDGASVNGRSNGNAPKIVYNVEETVVDPIVGADAKISVVSSKRTGAAAQPAVDMEAVGDELLANEHAEENADLDLALGDVEIDEPVVESASESVVAFDEPDSAVDFVSVAATRDVENDEPIAFDDADDEDEIEEDVVVKDSDELDVVSSAAIESPQDSVYAEGFDVSADDIVFDENDASDEESDLESLFDEESESLEATVDEATDETTEAISSVNESFVVELAGDDEIVFDSNDVNEEVVDETDEDELIVADSDVEDSEIELESNALVEETSDALVDVTKEVEEETVVVDSDVEDSEIELESNALVEETSDALVDANEEVEEETVVADSDVEDSEIELESNALVEETSDALVDANEEVEEETVVVDSDVEDSEIELESNALVEETSDALVDEKVDVEEVVEEETIVEESEVELETNDLVAASDEVEEDGLGDFLAALDANDLEDEIVFDDNDLEEDEIVFDENDVEDEDLSAIFDDDVEEEEDVVLEANDEEAVAEESDSVESETVEISSEEAVEETDVNAGKIFFKAKTDEKTTSSLPNIDALEREAEFFEDSSDLDVAKSADENAQTSSSELLEAVKTDDAYTSQILYDSDDDPKEESQEATPSEDAASKTDDVEESEKTDADQEETSVPADPCGPVVLCLSACGEENAEEAVPEQSVKESSNGNADYQKAPTTIRVSSQMVAEPEVAAPTAAPVDDELWIVTQGGSFWRLENGSWSRKEPKSFFGEDDPRRVTLFWAHGYQTDMGSASRSGFNLKAVVDAARAATGIDRKYRIVVWKWESERNNSRIRLDAMEKKNLAYYSGVELGKLIGRLNPKDDVVLMGFSFGAVVTGSALQTLATTSNGYMTGHKKPAFATSGTETEKEVASGRISLILVSAACDLGAFNQGGMFRSGASLPSRVLNVYNPNDYALKFYPLISGTSQAVGIAPLMGNEFMNAVGETYNLNANGYLGKEHSFDDAIQYISSTTLSSMIF